MSEIVDTEEQFVIRNEKSLNLYNIVYVVFTCFFFSFLRLRCSVLQHVCFRFQNKNLNCFLLSTLFYYSDIYTAVLI